MDIPSLTPCSAPQMIRIGTLAGLNTTIVCAMMTHTPWPRMSRLLASHFLTSRSANGVAIALEGIEGTDRCIERAGELCTRKNLVLVKAAKPNQDMRFDVPTIGIQTLETFANAGGQVIAIEAKKTILVDRTDVLEFADAHGIAVCAVQFEELTCGDDASV